MPSDIVTIDISTKTIIKFFLVAVSIYLIYILRGLVGVLLASIVIASSVEPAARFLGQWRCRTTLELHQGRRVLADINSSIFTSSVG